VAVDRAVELLVAGQVARLQCRLDADDAPLVPRVPLKELFAVAPAVLVRTRELARRARVETLGVSLVERQGFGRGDDNPPADSGGGSNPRASDASSSVFDASPKKSRSLPDLFSLQTAIRFPLFVTTPTL
jgi:hypothetical protein